LKTRDSSEKEAGWFVSSLEQPFPYFAMLKPLLWNNYYVYMSSDGPPKQDSPF